MRLTSMTDYAMRLLMYVGTRPERLCTIAEIAQAHQISEPHLMKITHRLAQCGWLETVRGKNGGMRLAHAPQDIRIGSIVRDMETDFSLIECFQSDSRCTLTGRCRLTHIIDEALQDFLHRLDQYTLADILKPMPDPMCNDGTTTPSPGDKVNPDKGSARRTPYTISQRTVIGWARKV